MAIADGTSYELLGSQVKDLVQNIKARAYDRDLIGATGSSAGTRGLAPTPAAGDQGKFLRGDGTWANVPLGTPPHIIMDIQSPSNDVHQNLWVLPTNQVAMSNFAFMDDNYNTLSVSDVYNLYASANGQLEVEIVCDGDYVKTTRNVWATGHNNTEFHVEISDTFDLWSDKKSIPIKDDTPDSGNPKIGVTFLFYNYGGQDEARINKFAVNPLYIYMNKFDAMNWSNWYGSMGGPMYQDTYLDFGSALSGNNSLNDLLNTTTFETVLYEGILAGVPIYFSFVSDGMSQTAQVPTYRPSIASLTDVQDSTFVGTPTPTFELHQNSGNYKRCIMHFASGSWSGTFI